MEGEYRLPLLGEKIPSFKAQTTKGKIKFPEDYKGKWVVLFSHPADFTPVCTTEFVAFQKRYEEFKKTKLRTPWTKHRPSVQPHKVSGVD